MRFLIPLIAAATVASAAPSGAASLSEDSFERMATADVVILGEVHDNPAHHNNQALLIRRLNPKAIVFEMITSDQAAQITPALIANRQAMENALGWADSGWPDFKLYHPIFQAATGAMIRGAAVPRPAARRAMNDVAAAFGEEADRYGLTKPLAEQEQAEREALQFEAHCDALPKELLPAMVDVQRLRDARLAQEAIRALEETGGPVVIITGNGHARADWGVPRKLRTVRQGLVIFTLGQTEDSQPLPGAFDAVLDAPGVTRPDPCDAFRN